jgi:hypothetical protein
MQRRLGLAAPDPYQARRFAPKPSNPPRSQALQLARPSCTQYIRWTSSVDKENRYRRALHRMVAPFQFDGDTLALRVSTVASDIIRLRDAP